MTNIQAQLGVPGHLPEDMKSRFGRIFSSREAIDQQDLMSNGTVEELEKDIIKKISVIRKDGGYLIAPAHILQNDVSPDRVLKFTELCRKQGDCISEPEEVPIQGGNAEKRLLSFYPITSHIRK